MESKVLDIKLLLLSGIIFLTVSQGCQSLDKSKALCDAELSDPEYFHLALDNLTDVIVHDIFSPPVASRVYAYPCIAAYQALVGGGSDIDDLSVKLKGLSQAPVIKDTAVVSLNLASLAAFHKVGKALIFSEDKMEDHWNKLIVTLEEKGVDDKIIEASMSYGDEIGDYILQWADKDMYKQSRSFSKFSLSDDPKVWKPTPPAYMEGIEPHWREIRTMVLDSAEQFVPEPPSAFDLDKQSSFYKETMEVYETGKYLKEEERAIASFWDCNPFVMNQTGHVMFATKKITPGGHWMGISNIATEIAKLGFAESIRTSTLVSIALFDAFISCWDEKYRSQLVRPETVINEHIDEDWAPLLQTPPFPEHTSGHSVISTAAATVLTKLFGDSFAYADDVELKYGLPVRKYNSFLEASQEAAISRLYGGIHYMPAITEGVKQGENVGALIIQRLDL